VSVNACKLIERDGSSRMPSLESTLDAGGFSIQVVKVFALRFSQHAVERYHPTK